jgi:hypothetical protein
MTWFTISMLPCSSSKAARLSGVAERTASRTSEYVPGDLVWHLRELVAEILAEGDHPREVVLGSLDDYRHVLRDTGRDEYEDDVQDVMDLMTGFGPSRLRI